ncbi:MAG TPA: FAD-binding oxidoreductase [Mycobacteriales bacterium]|nr:FAD-binding oxidoreductase [Mycobacteriales bacterium]
MGDDALAASTRDRSAGTPEPAARAVACPASLAEAHQAVRESTGTVLVSGGRTGLDWGGPVRDPDLVIDTTAMNRLITHNPADMTVAVQAGMRLADLQQALAPAGQWLALDPPTALAGPTLGGLLAGGDAGPRRLAHGALRDLVIGATVVLADGTVARAGGHVIKNVAGYDLGKLFAGSLGAFGLIAELVLRVHPRPPASVTLAVPADPTAALAATQAVRASPLEAVAVEWDGTRLLVRFEGTADGVAARQRDARGLDRLAGAEPLVDTAEQDAWDGLAAAAYGQDTDTVIRAGTRPDRLPDVVEALRRAAGPAGVTAELTSSVAAGVHTARLRGGDAAGHAACLRDWRAAVRDLGGTVTLRRRRDGVDDLVPAWGPPAPSVGVLRALKARFDPDRRFAPGRFAPWF